MKELLPILFGLIVVLGGASAAFQQVVNSRMRTEIGSPWWAGLISYIGGTIVMALAILITRDPWPSTENFRGTSAISWFGGLFGAIFIATAIFMVPRMGAATVVALIVVGQMVGSLVFDHFGVLGIPV
ncbi:MAG: DMT family transporter, partial [Gemmataceae bacterium]